ncbi:MAG: ATP-binding cassette domain-containing protein [Betaproteobacteria bacterium]|nr:ATP-binding cassette domain-containing protein [Betaproteobacteria bacterium]
MAVRALPALRQPGRVQRQRRYRLPVHGGGRRCRAGLGRGDRRVAAHGAQGVAQGHPPEARRLQRQLRDRGVRRADDHAAAPHARRPRACARAPGDRRESARKPVAGAVPGKAAPAATGRDAARSARGAQAVRRTGRGARPFVRDAERRNSRLDRAQRGGQEHHVQPDHGRAGFRWRGDPLPRRAHRPVSTQRNCPARHLPDLSARQSHQRDVGDRERGDRRALAWPARHAGRDAAFRSRRGGAAAVRSGAPARARRPRRAPARDRGKPAARAAAPGRDRARTVGGPDSAAARRAGRGTALWREEGAGRTAAPAAGRGDEHPAGRARHGVRDGAGRSAGGHGFRRKACARPAAGDSGRSRGGRSLSRRHRVNALLEVDDLRVYYGKVEGLHRASLRVPEGSIVTVIGPNGAGKTTLLGAIMGLLPSAGSARYAGADLAGTKTEARVGLGLSLVPERRELFGEMSVEDNLRLGAFHRFRKRGVDLESELTAIYARFPRLEERRAQLAATLSGGERQMLALGRALMARPRLLLLDEPSLGLAPRIVRDIFRIITELKKTGVSILLVEQNARAALQVADYGYVLETGEIVLEGEAAGLASNPRVIETYLGLAGKVIAT